VPTPPISVLADAPAAEVAEVQLRDPAVVARVRRQADCAPGDEVDVVVHAADPVARRVDLEIV
jgi:hypothetical protein